jgi:hypothetical protein
MDRQIKRQAVAVMEGAGSLFEKDKTSILLSLCKNKTEEERLLKTNDERMASEFHKASMKQGKTFEKQIPR